MALDLELSDAWLWRAVGGGSFLGGFPYFIGLYITCLASSSTIPRLLRAPQTKPKTKTHNPPPASPIDPMVWAQPHIPHIYTYTEAERIPVISHKINQNQSDATTQRPVPPKDQKQIKNKSPNVSQSFSHVPASSTQASKHRGYCPFIAVSSAGVGHGSSLGAGGSSLRASARKTGHDRSVDLCGCWHRAQQSGGCAQRRPFGQPGMLHGCW
jgi:hypothetical protein